MQPEVTKQLNQRRAVRFAQRVGMSKDNRFCNFIKALTSQAGSFIRPSWITYEFHSQKFKAFNVL